MVGRRTSQHTDFYGNFLQGSQQKQFFCETNCLPANPFPHESKQTIQQPLCPPPPHPNNPHTIKYHPCSLSDSAAPQLNELNCSACQSQTQPSGTRILPFWSLSIWDWEFRWKSQPPPTRHLLMPEGAGWRQSLAGQPHAKDSQEKRGLAQPNWGTAEQGEDKTFSN